MPRLPRLLSLLAIALVAVPAARAEESAGLSRFDSQVEPLIAQMTLAEKIGQMTQAELSAIPDLDLIAELGFGSILSGGNSDPAEGNSRKAWTETYDKCQRAALKSRLGIPLLYGIDAVHGHSNVEGAVIFPHNIGLGCADDVELIEKINRLTALEVRATGIQWTFAPCVTVPRDDRWGRTYEGFSEDPERVTRLGAAAVRGLQGADLSNPESVLACAKHWVGDGGTSAAVRESQFLEGVGIRLDQGDTQCDLETLRRVHMAPYPACIAEGVGSIMPSYSSWNGVKCTGSHQLLTEILKEELGFEGFLISDYNAIDQCDPDYKTAIGIAINAGIDMGMVPTTYREYINLLTELVDEGTVSIERIDDAVRRVLRVKAAMGLLDEDRNQLSDNRFATGFGSEERRQVAREAVQKSLVLLENNDALPLADAAGHRVHVVGAAADDIGIQCGGWTIDWQGKPGDITTGDTLLEGMQLVAEEAEITYAADGSGAEGADAAIVVVGEQPYAEGVGDNDQLTLSDADLAVIAKVRESGTPMVLVILSGRPLVLDDATRESAAAILAAWLPGSEGAGVADVLFGDASPTGTLSFTWPRSADQHPINIGDDEYDPLYPYGYGLKYGAPALSQAD
ncbi:MAG: glycoside hydrolase family 3 N-terminal domain-containing protein [Planctomycetota bacterium]